VSLTSQQEQQQQLQNCERISWNKGNLTISYIMTEDHGLWQCVVSNVVAEVTSNVTIKVKRTS